MIMFNLAKQTAKSRLRKESSRFYVFFGWIAIVHAERVLGWGSCRGGAIALSSVLCALCSVLCASKRIRSTVAHSVMDMNHAPNPPHVLHLRCHGKRTPSICKV